MSGTTLRYSSAFKVKVVTEIEAGKFTLAEARRIYDINIKGGNTIQKWIEQLGKTHLLNKVVRIQMKDERDQIKKHKHQIRALEKALSNAQVEILCWRNLAEVTKEKYDIDLKKNFGSKLPPELQEVLKNMT
jgi:transposase-like protein